MDGCREDADCEIGVAKALNPFAKRGNLIFEGAPGKGFGELFCGEAEEGDC
jgi:hypothetical protein